MKHVCIYIFKSVTRGIIVEPLLMIMINTVHDNSWNYCKYNYNHYGNAYCFSFAHISKKQAWAGATATLNPGTMGTPLNGISVPKVELPT
jgi:hypothetical protein